MTPRQHRAGAVLAALTLSLGGAACGDDANDQAQRAQRVADRLAEQRALSTSVPAGASPSSVVGPAAATGNVVPVVALDNSFRPTTVEVAVGDTVVWENRGRNEHDVLSIEGTLADGTAWGVTVDGFQPGDLYSHVFTEPGEYRYYCTIHGTSEVGMVGTVIVTR